MTAQVNNILNSFLLVYAALFPMLLNAWSGVRAVNPLWLRAAGAMGADERALFWKVIIPGASPFIITGLRQAFLRAWIAVIGAEMLAALIVIGAIGFALERLAFGALERATVVRWGMVQAVKD